MTDARRKTREEKQTDTGSLATPLFPGFEPTTLAKVRRYKRIAQPIWTENKAHTAIGKDRFNALIENWINARLSATGQR
jgi:hypothetical protein